MKNELIDRLRSGAGQVGVIGMGYVGLPLSLRLAETGYRVTGFDIDQSKVDQLNSGRSYISQFANERVAAANAHGMTATADMAQARSQDALIICVPTPLNEYRDPDLGFVTGTMDAIKPYLRAGQVLVLESTTWPGTTEEVLLPYLSERGFRVGEDFFLVYSPEREDPDNKRFDTRSIPKVISGHTSACLEVATALYEKAIDTLVPVSSTRAAEMTKLLENIHRAVNIGLVNEMKLVADRMDIDIFEVIRAAATKPFGFVPYYPGPGLGGHCIPIDPFYLSWKAKAYGVDTRFIELAGEINRAMPHWVLEKIAVALNDRGKPLWGSRILVLGIAYKKNVNDMRESPGVELMALLRERGADVCYADPHVPEFPRIRAHHFELSSTELKPATLAGFDCCVIATDHDGFDYELLREHAQLLVDTRGRYQEEFPALVRA